MRHRKGNKKLSKPTDQRIALLRGLTLSLIEKGKIVTSKQRAMETRRVVEQLVALSKKGGLSALRQGLAILPDKEAVTGFFKSAPERFKSNTGGVTRITKLGFRRGDNADMVQIELI